MISTKDKVVESLSEILPTEWEMSVDSGSDIPLITYRESNNYDYSVGNTFGYAKVSYLVKVWAYTIEELESYSILVDSKMRGLGFTRDNINELEYDGVLCKMMNYTALAREIFN